MSPAGKAMLVVAGLFMFCGISVLGPIFGTAGEFATSTVLGQSADQEVRNKRRALHDSYKKTASNTPILRKSADCCESPCGAKWDYEKDQCLVVTANQNTCFQACISKP